MHKHFSRNDDVNLQYNVWLYWENGTMRDFPDSFIFQTIVKICNGVSI